MKELINSNFLKFILGITLFIGGFSFFLYLKILINEKPYKKDDQENLPFIIENYPEI